VWQLPWLRPRDLAARVDPYLRRSPSSSLFAAPSSAGRARTVLENLMGPVAQRGMSVLERLTGGPEQLERRLRLAGRRTSIDSFRVEQVVFGAARSEERRVGKVRGGLRGRVGDEYSLAMRSIR